MTSTLQAVEDQKKIVEHIERVSTTFQAKPKDAFSRGYLQTILEDLESSFKSFKDGHDQLNDMVRESSIAEKDVPYLSTNTFYKCYDVYISLKTNILDLLFELDSPQTPTVHASTFAATSRNESFCAGARLPKIDLPTFSGDYLEWISYRDMFKTLVHQNNSLTKVQKYFYLKSSCTGTPLSLVNEYPAAESSYDLAWDALEKRFHNERKLVEQILKRLFSIPPSDGTLKNIKGLLDTTRTCLSQLKSLKIDISTWDSILVYLITQKLEMQTRKEWEQSLKASTSIPPMSDMLNFLETTFRTMESLEEEAVSTTHVYGKENRKKPTRVIRAHTASTVNDNNCLFCNKRHPLYKCFRFTTLSSAEKKSFVNQHRLCRNCLNTGHLQSSCRLNTRCHICREPHHTIIHNEFGRNNSDQTTSPLPNIPIENQTFQPPATTSTPNSATVSTNVSNLSAKNLNPALLPTVKVLIKTLNKTYCLKALVDQGSQLSFISEELSQILPAEKYKTRVNVSGIGGNQAVTVKKSVRFTIHSRYEQEFALPITALVVPNVTSYVPNKITSNFIPDLSAFFLADPDFLTPQKIDLLLGNDVYGDLLLPRMKKFENSLLLQETHLGWMISGSPRTHMTTNTISANLCSLDEQLRMFWEQEELLDKKSWSTEDELCEKLFNETHIRDENGRYSVHLPFKRLLQGKELPSFSHTDYNAIKRLKQLELSFKQKPQFANAYKKFMIEYELLNHMSNLGEYPHAIPQNAYFFPHHGVLKENSSTTKLRVVFDGGNRRPPQTSINEELSAGPALQNDLSTIITRWRKHYIGFTADLEKMFRQINVSPEHQPYQCILWRNATNKICVYALRTVTYGTTSAPYLAIRVLQQLSEDEETNFPEASHILRTDTYVDDVISGADTLEESLELQQQLSNLLKSGGFHLRKWNSNSFELMKNIPEEDREIQQSFSIYQPKMSKALGINWNTNNDYFYFSINFRFSEQITKSSLLSEASKLFDPLGWLSATTIIAKIIFQQLWKLKIDWNDTLPDHVRNQWVNFRNKLKSLEEVKIPRWIGYRPHKAPIDLHAFSDASKVAYAAVVYARVTTESGEILVNLLQAKTKVVPLKGETIPRLELNAATLMAELVAKIKANVDLNIGNVIYWTDSTIVLAWLKNNSTRLEVYVANRVAKIQRLSNVHDWRYVPTKDNPADCASRGLMPEQLIHHYLWWKGPSWLQNTSDSWPTSPNQIFREEIICNNLAVHLTKTKTTIATYPEITQRFSKLSSLVRVTSYILRFYNNIKLNQNNREVGFLKTYELKQALHLLIKLTQAVSFHDEIKTLKLGNRVPNQSNIVKLSPFLDEKGILRVGGRISNSTISYNAKHPILLSKQNPLSFLIFLDAHVKTFHGSLQLMQSYVSRYYWIVSARNIAKRVQRRCTVCFKYKAQSCQQLMGNLPSVRLQPTRAFKHSGLDYAGPINIKTSSLRTASTSKGYISLFICMCTKAIHLEAVTSLNVDAFLAAFRRFTARRGLCTDLYSDCGTNFVGANKELQVLYHRNKASLPEHLAETLANQGTKWHFIPPASPHFGGLWEAGVKSTKHHLRRIMKDRILTYEELSTLLAQIESCLNSRPLCPLSTDPTDADVLTPAHFLIGEPSICIPDDDLLDANIDRLSRWKLIEHLKQNFWDRWNKEYLCRLQARPKWNKVERNIKVGDIVLLLHERSTAGQWPLAKVEELHPGSDGLVRVVTLYCNGKHIKRPISKICFLPSNDMHNDEKVSTI
ncbi:uncharacterized protein LOC135955527 [Calliphora vicina]|uniref:uncharacterized protein LOC135955527 n=1 Tax=Calliphora vicina TaxID=7373 RepID=UPI00325AD12C